MTMPRTSIDASKSAIERSIQESGANEDLLPNQMAAPAQQDAQQQPATEQQPEAEQK
jgi:hypothetical protein